MINDSVLYNIKVYNNNIFSGYVKMYRYYNGKYRFEITKNIIKSLQYKWELESKKTIDKLTNDRDRLLEIGVYTFESSEVTNQDIRRSKLDILKRVKIRKGIFKK